MAHAWSRFLCTVMLCIVSAGSGAQIAPAQWAADLDALADGLLQRHPNFYTKTSVEDFEDALLALHDRLGTLDDQLIAMEFSRLVALGGDAHTTVGFGEIGTSMRRLPIRIMVMEDGVFVTFATREHQELIGSRLVSINGVEIEEVLERVSVLFAYENDSKKRGTSAWYGTLLPALRAVGVIEDHDSQTLRVTLKQGGEAETHELACEPKNRGQQWISFVQLLEQPWPIAYRKQRGYYQTDYIAEHETFYIAYNRCREAEDLPMERLVEFVMSKCDELDARRIIIDLRFNGGGDETVIWPLWQALEKSERFKDPGDIIGLISRQTFSSAMSNSHQLRDSCGAVLIGEPTGGKPNHFGQLSSFQLPNSGLTISHSTRWFQKVEGDPDAVHPDVLIPWQSGPLFEGEDPVLDAALMYEPEG
ncbi:MAG: S41 family peptidase [Phycisphaerales bacterium]